MWLQVHASGVYESWSEVELALDGSRPPEPVELAGGDSGGGGEVLHGLRYRLAPLDVESTRPLPADGKVRAAPRRAAPYTARHCAPLLKPACCRPCCKLSVLQCQVPQSASPTRQVLHMDRLNSPTHRSNPYDRRVQRLPLYEHSEPLTAARLHACAQASVLFGSLSAEALVRLPELPTRDSEEGAAALWVTVGLLAKDGLVLQVKLKKAAKVRARATHA